MSSDEGVRAIMILDIIGRPPEHLIENLESLIKEIDSEKGVKVVMKDIKKPTPVKEHKDIYTTFAEVEVEVERKWLEEFHLYLFPLEEPMPEKLGHVLSRAIALSDSWVSLKPRKEHREQSRRGPFSHSRSSVCGACPESHSHTQGM